MNVLYETAEEMYRQWVGALLLAEVERVERDAAQAIVLTPRDRWAHLQMVSDPHTDAGAGLGHVACSWPDPIPDSILAVRARLAMGEG